MMIQLVALFILTGCLCAEGAVSCDHYESDICAPDLKGYCLYNKTIIMGTCEAQIAICRDGAVEATDFGCCTGSSVCVPERQNDSISLASSVLLIVSSIVFRTAVI